MAACRNTIGGACPASAAMPSSRARAMKPCTRFFWPAEMSGPKSGPWRGCPPATARSARSGGTVHVQRLRQQPAARGAGLTAVRTMALTATGITASRSASSNTICGDFPPAQHATDVVPGCRHLHQRAHFGRAIERQKVDARMRSQRSPGFFAQPGDDIDGPVRKPASCANCTIRSGVRQASSAGFITVAFPSPAPAPAAAHHLCRVIPE